MRILVIEDEKKVAGFIRKGLVEHSYAVDVAHDGAAGESLATKNEYDLIVLDVLLPRQDGWETCRKIRERGIQAPILMLTSLRGTEEKVRGLDSGADDYLTKPFALSELLARVRALLRRQQMKKDPVLSVGGLRLDPATYSVTRDSRPIRLTAKEFALLEFLLRNHGRVLTRAQISEHVWEVDFGRESNIIDVYIRLLRRKVDRGFSRALIHTVVGVGYVLKEET